MKSLICASVILCLVIFSTVFVAIYTDIRLGELIATVDQAIPDNDPKAARLGAENVEDEYKRIKTYLILFIRENEVRDIEMHISDIKSAAMTDDVCGVTTAKNRLTLHIEQLRRLSVFSIEAIF